VAVAEVLHSLEVVESGLCPDRTAGSGDGLLELLERFRDVHAFLSKGPVIVPYDRPWRDRVRESGWDALPVGANGSLNPPSPAAGDTYHLRRVKE